MSIACELYDYIEISCIYQLEISVELKNGEMKSGRALSTLISERNGEATECLRININGLDENIPLVEIAQLHAIADNPHFTTIRF